MKSEMRCGVYNTRRQSCLCPLWVFCGQLNNRPQDMGLVGNVIPMFQVCKLRLRRSQGCLPLSSGSPQAPSTCWMPGGSGNCGWDAEEYSCGGSCRLEEGWPPTGNWFICWSRERRRQRVGVGQGSELWKSTTWICTVLPLSIYVNLDKFLKLSVPTFPLQDGNNDTWQTGLA